VIGYSLATPIADALARNRRRESHRRVPDVAISATAKKLSWPRFVEGFDRLYAVSVARLEWKAEDESRRGGPST
jgi:hypothetical protein